MTQLFLVERYDVSGTPDWTRPLPAPPEWARVVLAVRVPADDVVLALVEGTDEHTVCVALAAVGWRVDRITTATRAVPVAMGSTPN